MGCYVSKCNMCRKEIKADNHLAMKFKEMEHEESDHPEIYKKNKKAKLLFNKEYKKINDKFIFSTKNIFTQSKWDGEDMTDEEAREKGYLD